MAHVLLRGDVVVRVSAQAPTLGAAQVTGLDHGEVIGEPGTLFTVAAFGGAVPADFVPGKYLFQGGALGTNPAFAAPSAPVDRRRRRELSRVRFDHVFAGALGERAYDDVLDALATIAAATPKTNQSAKVKRALRALGQAASITFPIGDDGRHHPVQWKSTPHPDDLTGQFLRLVITVAAPTIPEIEAKIDAALMAWPLE